MPRDSIRSIQDIMRDNNKLKEKYNNFEIRESTGTF